VAGRADRKAGLNVMGLFSRFRSASAPASTNSPPRVLFLDDDPVRAALFQEDCPHAVWVKTAAECIARLEEAWDEVHLDHDLGGEQFVDTNRGDCGMEVVRWICLAHRPHLKSTRFTIHSHNPVAATTMGVHMTVSGFKCQVRPFGVPAGATPEPVEDPGPPLTRWQRIKRGVFRAFGMHDEVDPAFYDYLATRTDVLSEEARPRVDFDWLRATDTRLTAADEAHGEAAEREPPQTPPFV
jgi:hypothetical protein